MNLTEQILVRGWIKRVPWDVLDEQLPDGSEPARQQVKRLRRALAVKARVYGSPAVAELWQGERLPSERWQRQLLVSLADLAARPDPVPQADHRVSQWLDTKLCESLPKTVTTLTEAVNWLAKVETGTAVPERQHATVNALIRLCEPYAEVLGYKPKPSAQKFPMARAGQMALLENIAIPEHMNGTKGSNRATVPSRISAGHDLEAIHSWLALKVRNKKTYEAYKKEIERLLLWAVLERGKALSSLNTDDCQAYIEFLTTLTPDRTEWVTNRPALKKHKQWRPFYYRPASTVSGSDEALPTVLSPGSIRYAHTVISNCMDWLVKQQYLQHNNFEGLARNSGAVPGLNTQRAFTAEQMQMILREAETQVRPEAPDFTYRRRTLFILRLAMSTGLRIHELAGARFGAIEWLDDAAGPQYFINVTGKGQRVRKTSLPETLVEEIKAYLRLRGQPTHFEFLPAEAPLIPNLRDPSGRRPLTPAGLHKILAGFFAELCEHLKTAGSEDNRLLMKLQQASTHWLRHSYGSFLANDRQVPLAFIRDEMGHANISTTSRYLNSDAKARQKAVSEAFGEFVGDEA